MSYKTPLILLGTSMGPVVVALMTTAFVVLSSSASAQLQPNENSTAVAGDTNPVSVGTGNLTVSYNQFMPQDTEIAVGESVTFFNPTPEIHSVIFDLSNETIVSDVILPFTVSGSPQFDLQPPFNVGEPMLETNENGTQTLVTFNKIVFTPTVVDETNSANYLNGTEVSYSLTGKEQAISSGIMMPTDAELETMYMEAFPEEMMAEETSNSTAQEDPEEMYEPVIKNTNKFTLTFEEAGTFEYFCPFHPAMYGQITVR